MCSIEYSSSTTKDCNQDTFALFICPSSRNMCMRLCEVWADLCVQRVWQQMSSQWEREHKSLCVYVFVCVSVCQCMCEQQVCEVSQQDPYVPASKQTCCFEEIYCMHALVKQVSLELSFRVTLLVLFITIICPQNLTRTIALHTSILPQMIGIIFSPRGQ